MSRLCTGGLFPGWEEVVESPNLKLRFPSHSQHPPAVGTKPESLKLVCGRILADGIAAIHWVDDNLLLQVLAPIGLQHDYGAVVRCPGDAAELTILPGLLELRLACGNIGDP